MGGTKELRQKLEALAGGRAGVILTPGQQAQIKQRLKELNAQDFADALQRDAQLRKTRAELLRAIFNRPGLERLRAVTDADWREAEEADNR